MTSHTPSSHTILHIVLRHTPSYTLSAGVAQGDIHLRFVLRGRRGALSHPLSFCVAGVALMALGGALGLVLVARDAAALCVAGVAQSHIHLRFAWQAWHVWHWVARLGWFWSPVTPRHFAAALCVAGVAHSHIHFRFAWQAWHNLTSAFVFVAGVAQSHTHLCHTPSVTYHLCHTPSVSKCCYTPSFIQSLSTILSRTSLSHTSRFTLIILFHTHFVTIATGICSKTVRQLWIEEHDVELQSTMRLIAAEERRKRRMLREGCPDSSDSD